MFLGGTMAPRGSAQWSASPLDLLAENQPGTRLDGIPQLFLQTFVIARWPICWNLDMTSRWRWSMVGSWWSVVWGETSLEVLNIWSSSSSFRSDDLECLRSVEIYCPSSNKFVQFLKSGLWKFLLSRWSRGPDLTTARAGSACLNVPNFCTVNSAAFWEIAKKSPTFNLESCLSSGSSSCLQLHKSTSHSNTYLEVNKKVFCLDHRVISIK